MNLTQNEIDINFNDDDNFFMEIDMPGNLVNLGIHQLRLIYTRDQITIYSLRLVPRYNRLGQDIFPRQ